MMGMVTPMMKRARKKYKVMVRFSQEMPFIVEAHNAAKALQLALRRARECATESEQLETTGWIRVDEAGGK